MASSSSEPSDELATAVGRYVLGDISLGHAAEAAGLSRWEFEEVLEDAGFTALYGPRTDDQRQATVKREEGRDTSRRIHRLYRTRTRRRDHAQNALVRDLVKRLHEGGIATVYVGDLTDVLETHWSCDVNEKTHQFWAYRRFIDRFACVCEEYGITLEIETEAWTSQACPQCGSTDGTTRHRDTLTCGCGFEGHADLTASETFLQNNSDRAARPMARPVRLKWDNHKWRPDQRSPPAGTMTNEERTNRSTVEGKLAAVEPA